MTPAVTELTKSKVLFDLHEYTADPAAPSYGLEAAEALEQPPERVFKTLVVANGSGELAVAVLPVSCELNLKAMAKAVGTKRVQMAEPEKVERTTGYVLGGVSPFGQKRRLPTVLDQSAAGFEKIFVSGGRRGLEIEISPTDLKHCLGAIYFEVGISK